MNLSLTSRAPYAPPIEFVERKGTGHPDTICDHLAEKLARQLARDYEKHTGAIRHFNVDKAILASGSVDIGFGGGVHTKPSKLVLVGKAAFNFDWKPDPDALAAQYHQHLMELLPDATPESFDVEVWLNESSPDLAAIVDAETIAPLANDTSFAAVSMPRSILESTVYAVETHLNSDDYRASTPIGRDIKVMGLRVDGNITITVACPVLATKVADRDEYNRVVLAVQDEASTIASGVTGRPVSVQVNQADQEDSAYLTLTGTSAEAGDDGQVGRGNRFGGLITPYRPMSLEAAAGKNPASHVGKTYHAIGYDITQHLIAETDASEVTIRLLSSIGHSVTEPQAVHIETAGTLGVDEARNIAEKCFDDWSGVTERLIDGQYELY
ncbi:MAG: methionine adenosyltransferase [Actinomycetota bacterium]|nr:methionine adenosyltransferase [Actinomycetota bacterium]